MTKVTLICEDCKREITIDVPNSLCSRHSGSGDTAVMEISLNYFVVPREWCGTTGQSRLCHQCRTAYLAKMEPIWKAKEVLENAERDKEYADAIKTPKLLAEKLKGWKKFDFNLSGHVESLIRALTEAAD